MKKNGIQILQFGTGNFLRAFIEPMVQDLNQQDISLNVCMIQSTGGSNLEQLKKQNYEYHVLVAGLENGKKVEQLRKITCIKDGLDLPLESERFLQFASDPEVKWIISNVTEAGMVWKEEEDFKEFAKSFAGRITQWLFRRFQTLPQAETILLPCELLQENGKTLKNLVETHAKRWKLQEEFFIWMDSSCKFFNSLVDRIVPGFPSHLSLPEKEKDKFLVQTEPYCFWAIEGKGSDEAYLPFLNSFSEAILQNSIQIYSLRKIRILNGLHTFMTGKGLLQGFKTVGQYVDDPRNLEELEMLLKQEIFPTLDIPSQELEKYARQVMDRFRNPFVAHRLADISLNATAKFKSRLFPIFEWHQQNHHSVPPIAVTGLVAQILFNLRNPEKIKDTSEVKNVYSTLPPLYSEFEQVIFIAKSLFGLEDHMGIKKAYETLLSK